MPIFRRMELVIALYTQLESFQHNLHMTKELLKGPAGTRLEMDVLYLGLAQAFGVSRDDQWSLIGYPRADGWVWRPKPEIGTNIRTALAIYMRKQAAEFVRLPLRINSHNHAVADHESL